MRKKGQVGFGNFSSLVLAVVFAVIFLAIGLIVMDKLLTQTQVSTSTRVNNLSFWMNTTNAHYISQAAWPYFSSMDTSTIIIINGSAGKYTLMAAGNYSVGSNGSLVLIDGIYNYTDTNITYTYNWLSTEGIASDINKTIEGVGDFGQDWVPVLVVVICAAIIIGLIIVFTGRRKT